MVASDYNVKHTNTEWENAKYLYVTVHVKYSNSCGVKGARYMWETNISPSYVQVYYVACVQ